ncbi:MAG: DUF2760 domain-containing protein [Planctomycetota bacterium]|nr:DUF2760 domain-containing protein [Planctomycetota bacterium]
MNVFQRIGIGLEAWYWAWFVAGGAERLAPAVKSLRGPELREEGTGRGEERETTIKPPVSKTPPPPPKPAPAPKPTRSDAFTLLEALQREARLIDFLKEDVAPYEDAQIGAAVRDIHRDAAKLLERLFAIRPVIEQAEGSAVTLTGSEAGRVRLVGNVRDFGHARASRLGRDEDRTPRLVGSERHRSRRRSGGSRSGLE